MSVPFRIAALVAILIIVFLTIDLVIPLGLAGGVLHVAVVLLAIGVCALLVVQRQCVDAMLGLCRTRSNPPRPFPVP